jgi:trans-aconitate methyltransferase
VDLKEEGVLGEFVEQHWYYRSKAAALLRMTSTLQSRRVLDVGAGSGFFSRKLLTGTEAQQALCIDPNYEKEWDESVVGKPIHFRRSCDSTNADLLIMMDVLEHVQDDQELLDSYVDMLTAGSYVLVTVPAFMFMWSGHDEFLGHYRRYTLKQMIGLLEESGLQLEQYCYYFGLVFPLAAAMRLLSRLTSVQKDAPSSDLKKHNALTNSMLSFLCRMEIPLFRFNRLAGLSVFCLARKC